MTDDSIFDNPYFIATVNAQTRVMNELGETVHLDYKMTEKLTLMVKSQYRPPSAMGAIMDFVLNLYEPFGDAERRAQHLLGGRPGRYPGAHAASASLTVASGCGVDRCSMARIGYTTGR